MGAVAAGVGRNNQNGSRNLARNTKTSSSLETETVLMGDSIESLKEQILQIERIRNEKAKAAEDSMDVTSPELNDEQRLLLKSKLLKGFISLLKSRIQMKHAYLRLLAILTFFGVYCATLVVQRNISGSFGVQSR